MSFIETPRALMLERLESRCLLAGELFAEITHWQLQQNERLDSSDRADHRTDRPAIIGSTFQAASERHGAPQNHGSSDRTSSVRSSNQLIGGRSHAESLRVMSRPGDSFRNGSPQSESLRQNGNPQRSSSTLTPVNVIHVPLSSTETTAARPDPELTSGSVAERQEEALADRLAWLGSSVGTSGIDRATHAPSDVSETTPSTSVPDRDFPQTNRDVDARSQSTSSDAISVSDAPISNAAAAIVPLPESALSPGELHLPTVNVDQLVDGTIIHLPSFNAVEQSPDATGSGLPWELGSETLQRLRDIADATDDADVPSEFRGVDHTIASWFGEATGLIDNIHCETELPAITQTINASMVDVVLDATVGMHRSVGLIADASVDDGDDLTSGLRGEILAVIASEFADALASEEPPRVEAVDAPTPIRLSGIAYPGALVVASLLAISTRRRSRRPSLTAPRAESMHPLSRAAERNN
ncbi:hypothetical protein [Stieleria mannarensis]|uniref:hypothetical protein n=1 Tax=Stieleria mannarensis TaxID=2755585 RepID=UPI0016014590|nr:hypothetical protein [Rhodopirellula sp. JC639]